MLFIGLLIGGAAAYFVAHTYSQVFQQFVSGPVYERVIVAAQLRAGLQDKTLSQSDEIIAQALLPSGAFLTGTNFLCTLFAWLSPILRRPRLPRLNGRERRWPKSSPCRRSSLKLFEDHPIRGANEA